MPPENTQEHIDEIRFLLKQSQNHRLYERIRDTVFAFSFGIVAAVSIAPKIERPETHHDDRLTEAIIQIRDDERQESIKIDSLQKVMSYVRGLLPPSSSRRP